MSKLIRKLIAAGLVIGVFAGSALACDIQREAPYGVSVTGTGSVGYEGVGTITMFNNGDVTGILAVHFPNRRACESTWTGTYVRNTEFPGTVYGAQITVAGACLPKNGVVIEMLIVPSGDGSHIRLGTMLPTGDNMNGTGDVQE